MLMMMVDGGHYFSPAVIGAIVSVIVMVAMVMVIAMVMSVR